MANSAHIHQLQLTNRHSSGTFKAPTHLYVTCEHNHAEAAILIQFSFLGPETVRFLISNLECCNLVADNKTHGQ